MKAFAALYHALDASTSSNAKQAALQAYLRAAAPQDAAWAVYFLAGGKPRQLVPTRVLRDLAREAAALPEWLFEESYDAVGDLAETISLLLPAPTQPDDRGLADWMAHDLLPLRGLPPDAQRARLLAQWQRLAPGERLPYFKLITGAFRVGVSKLQVTQALAAVGGLDAKTVAQRLMGYTAIGAQPTARDYLALIAPHDAPTLLGARGGQPYPFFLAHPFNEPLARFDELLGAPADWLIEWKWDGIRAQLVRRDGDVWLWSRGEELITERFPELQAMGHTLPEGTVIDGEIVVWKAPETIAASTSPSSAGAAFDAQPDPDRADALAVLAGCVQPFAELQKRIGRKTVTPKLLREQPAALLAYDLLEDGGQDLRTLPQHQRRARLEALVAAHPHPALHLSPHVEGPDWPDLARQRDAARRLGTEGFMLKRRDAAYGVGRTKDVGVWWKWKIDPMSVDAVLIYAQRGHGRRASLYSDYTFAVWSGPPEDPGRTLVPFAKAYSGLTDEEMRQVDAIVRKTTRESFGPVRSVEPTLVFELGFEGIARSARHKSGIAVRFPRMLRWRVDKPVDEADTLATLAALLPTPGHG
ncbi:ATP-dependent DNA ligase [Ottowia sp.]|uniref:ATP-dependent DNA ligase n=1 Tax=Ottowia sp. TaxID=1898956 RepID=UPI002CDE951B|nr:ATP-dependent DNA ligase [Ottowia sp.]HOB67089.1 ATP-dependent DNA ligase [Ottowia sp.]HPZ56285.1 ATP-dependent DNA ligase [Ottowia sp.]HQD47528.1 ATP-dependent DNA ligase [Ottowia sp.]